MTVSRLEVARRRSFAKVNAASSSSSSNAHVVGDPASVISLATDLDPRVVFAVRPDGLAFQPADTQLGESQQMRSSTSVTEVTYLRVPRAGAEFCGGAIRECRARPVLEPKSES